jgi:N,N'-diacetyllegionaminate synthase
LARQLVDEAVKVGADAIKFQTYRTKNLVTISTPKAHYQLRQTDSSESQFDMLRRLELSDDEHRELFAYCQERNILFLSTPFDEESADFLEGIGVLAFKVPSGEITNHPFLAFLAAKKKPLLVSTGMADLGEVEQAVRTIERAGNSDFVLLQCVSDYPADPSTINLRAMNTMSVAFGKSVGFSDHTEGIEVALGAVGAGACIIEKHFTLDRELPGPDHSASLEPEEFAALVIGIRKVEAALGAGKKEPAASEMDTAEVARKSLVAGQDIPAGCVLTEGLIKAKRPGTGLPPSMLRYLVGRTVKEDIAADSLLTLEMLI